MQPHAPDVLPAGPADFSVPRVAARTSGQSGFLFVNNHVRGSAMPARENFQVTIKLPNDKSVTLPSHPITLPSDAYFVWPFNMDLSGLHLRYATAQPLAILGTKAAPVYAFVSQPNIPAEFLIDDMAGLKLNRISGSRNVQVTVDNTTISLLGVPSGPDPILNCTLPNGRSVTILLLSQRNADHAWKINSGAQTQLLLTDQQAFVDGDVVTLQSLGAKNFTALLVPNDSMHLVSLDKTARIVPGTGIFVPRPSTPGTSQLNASQTQPASSPAPLPAGFKPSTRPRVVAAAPTDADFARAAIYSIPLPATALADTPTEQHFLRITYTGDVARLSAPIDGKDHLLDDNFSAGTTLARRPLAFRAATRPSQQQSGAKLDLAIYPLRPNPPIFFEPGHEPKPDAPPVVQQVELLTQYTLKLKLPSPRPEALIPLPPPFRSKLIAHSR